jgi:hypothetical protein
MLLDQSTDLGDTAGRWMLSTKNANYRVLMKTEIR